MNNSIKSEYNNQYAPFLSLAESVRALLVNAPAHATALRVKASITFTRICGLWHITKNISNKGKNKKNLYVATCDKRGGI